LSKGINGQRPLSPLGIFENSNEFGPFCYTSASAVGLILTPAESQAALSLHSKFKG